MKDHSAQAKYGYESIRNYNLPIVVGKQVHRRTFPPSMHFHNSYELLFISSGDYQVYAPQMLYEGHGAALLLFGRGIYHSVTRKQCEITPFCCNDIYFQQNVLDAVPPMMLNIRSLQESSVVVLPLQEPQMNFLLPKINEMWQYNHPKPGESRTPPILYSLLITVLNYMNELVQSGVAERFDMNVTSDSYIIDVMKEIVDVIDAGKDVSVTDIADRFFVSHTKLSKDFRREVGISIKDVIGELRLTRAKSLLRNGLEVQKVAELCGFSSTSYFIQFFRKYTGMSPGDYRRRSAFPEESL